MRKTYAEMTKGEIAAYRRGWMSGMLNVGLPVWMAGTFVSSAVGFAFGLVYAQR